MVNIIGVRFKRVGKVYYFDPGDIEVNEGQSVIVETTRGIEMGEVVMRPREVEESKITPPLKKLIRAATDEDIRHVGENAQKEKEALAVCEKKIREHQLDMKVIDVEYTFDNNKILFYFTADGRVDFRELVKDLASVFRTRIELRQIGVRDEAKMTGGLGICGLPFCCSTFLGEFHSVSIKMAKDQGLSLNPTKISGTCGRLMCCLKYEQNAYEDLLQNTPKNGSFIDTPDGRGVVVDSDIFRGRIKVRLDASSDAAPQEYVLGDINEFKSTGRVVRRDKAECPGGCACAHGDERRAPPDDAPTATPADTPPAKPPLRPRPASAPRVSPQHPTVKGDAQPTAPSREQRSDRPHRGGRRPFHVGGVPARPQTQQPNPQAQSQPQLTQPQAAPVRPQPRPQAQLSQTPPHGVPQPRAIPSAVSADTNAARPAAQPADGQPDGIRHRRNRRGSRGGKRGGKRPEGTDGGQANE